MHESSKQRLKKWVDELENPAFVSMTVTETGDRVRLTAEKLLEHYPEPDDNGEMLNWLRGQKRGGVFNVLRDKLPPNRG